MNNNYLRIFENRLIAEKFYEITLEDPDGLIEGVPGQFLHIKIPRDKSLLLRRPISINDIDIARGRVHLVYQVVGQGTKILSSLKPGVKLDILGPLGRGFSIPEGTKTLYLVGGGCGVAPLRFIGRYWDNLKITSFLGFRNRASSYQIEDFRAFSENLYLATDDGSLGDEGLVTNLLDGSLAKEKPDLILGCGPTPMLRALKNISAINKIPCQISLEERMGCGVGGCLVCVCAATDGKTRNYKKVCSDGPVFGSEEVDLNGCN